MQICMDKSKVSSLVKKVHTMFIPNTKIEKLNLLILGRIAFIESSNKIFLP